MITTVIIRIILIIFIISLAFPKYNAIFDKLTFYENGYCKHANRFTNFSFCHINSTLQQLLCEFVSINYTSHLPPGPITMTGHIEPKYKNCFRKSSLTFPTPVDLSVTLISVRRPPQFDFKSLKYSLNLFEFDLLITLSWYDFRLCYPCYFDLIEMNYQIDDYLRKLLWFPNLIFIGSHSIRKTTFLTPFQLFQLHKIHKPKYRMANLQLIYRSFNQLFCKEEAMHTYYLETFHCMIEVQLSESKELVCLRLKTYPFLSNGYHKSGYHIKLSEINYDQCSDSSNSSCIQMNFIFTRNPASITVRLHLINLVFTLMSLFVLLIPVEQHFIRVFILTANIIGFIQMVSQFSVFNYHSDLNYIINTTFWQTCGLEMLVMFMVALDLFINRWFFLSAQQKTELITRRRFNLLSKAFKFLEQNQISHQFFYNVASTLLNLLESIKFTKTNMKLLFRSLTIMCFIITCVKIGLSFYYANHTYQQQMNTKVKTKPTHFEFTDHIRSLLPLTKNNDKCKHYDLIKFQYFKNIVSNMEDILQNPFCLNEDTLSALFF